MLLQLPPGRDYLRIALLISLCLHGAALWLHWPQSGAPASRQPPIEVVLVNTQTPSAPVAPTVLAQQQLDGGGDTASGHAASPLPRTVTQSPDEMVLEALRKRQAALEARQAELLTQLLQAPDAAPARQPDPALLQQSDLPGEDDLARESQIINARIAALKDRIDHYNAQPRRQFTGPSAARVEYAQYVETWRRLIEQLGTEHYPDQARGQIYGSLQLTVHIRRDGSLERIDVDQPSEHAILNLAAQRIVRLAAPFAPLPDEIARTTDVLAITRTWHFIDNRLDTAP